MAREDVGEPPAERPVIFVAHDLPRRWPELRREDACIAMADVPASRWAPLENIWIVSTYLRLRARGENVRIRSRVLPGHINICCDERVVDHPQSHRGFLVVTRGDRGRIAWADYELVQSPAQKCRVPWSLMKHWPQPGLLPRDPGRGDEVKTIGYVGPSMNLAEAYYSDAFQSSLKAMGVELVLKTDPRSWHDYRDLDLFLAVRDWPRPLIETKPATKLAHAWITGATALLGDEPAYRYWGEVGTDYFEVSSPEQALEVIRRLKAEPEVYRATRKAGRLKALEHDEASVTRQWSEILAGPVRAEFEQWIDAVSGTWRRRAIRRQAQRLTSRIARRWFQLRALGLRGVKGALGRRLGLRRG